MGVALSDLEPCLHHLQYAESPPAVPKIVIQTAVKILRILTVLTNPHSLKGVHFLYQVIILLCNEAALQLHGRCQLFVFGG